MYIDDIACFLSLSARVGVTCHDDNAAVVVEDVVDDGDGDDCCCLTALTGEVKYILTSSMCCGSSCCCCCCCCCSCCCSNTALLAFTLCFSAATLALLLSSVSSLSLYSSGRVNEEDLAIPSLERERERVVLLLLLLEVVVLVLVVLEWGGCECIIADISLLNDALTAVNSFPST